MTTQQNVINDLGTVTNVPNKIINALIEKLNLCIGSAIHDAILTKEDMIQINVESLVPAKVSGRKSGKK